MLSIPPIRAGLLGYPALVLALVASLATTARAAEPPQNPQKQNPQNPDCCFYSVSGTVWYDQNGNGLMDGGEPPLSGWTVEALDISNTVVGTTTTDGSGNYTFAVPVGCGATFKLRQVVQPGWNQTYPPSNGWHTGSGTGCAGTAYGPYNFGDIQSDCGPFQKTYTLDADFNLGTLNGVITNSDQLELSNSGNPWPYAWVANAGEGTISKIDTQTGKELARYYTGPPDMNGYAYLSPSRTVVDRNGNCWVANRNFGSGRPSVTEISASGGIDWNANSVINTSSDANNNGQIDPWEILPWGQDERVIRHYLLGAPTENARGMVLDKMGFLWVGLCTSYNLVKVDPNLPTSIYSANNPPTAPPVLATVSTAHMPYGLALSPNGMIYQSTIGPHALQIDPGIASGGTGAGPAVTEYINHGGVNYGITVDKNCIVWIAYMMGPSGNYGCVRWDPPLTMGNPANGWTVSGPGAPGPGRGIAIDFNNDVWMACNDNNNSVVKFSNTVTPTVLGVYPTPSPVPVGVGPASDGNIIVTPSGASNWCKVNVSTGAVMPLPGPQLVGYGPYTYSDFTGSQLSMTGLMQGTWTVITDGGSSQMVWNYIGWNSATPPSTSVLIEARTAQNLIALGMQPWTTIGSPGLLGTPMPGRYIETRARLQRVIEHCGEPFVTPILYDLTVKAICDPCGFVNCPSDTTIQCMSPQGAEFFYPTPVLKSICDSTYVVTCTPAGNFFPIGTTAVKCIAVNASNDTVVCQFNVTVTGNCDPPPTGACCIHNFCSVTTQAQCELQGGIYFGDNTTCQNGCNRNCVVPPNNLVAWWPLNNAPSGVTPNLAGSATGGTLVNSPAPLTGQEVGNSYSFDGSTQYIQVPHNATLNLGAGDFSVDAWVMTRSVNGVASVIDKRDPKSIQGFAFFLYNGYPALQLAVGNAWSNYILTNANGGAAAFVGDGRWHLVAATVDRDNPAGVQFYVDGAAVGTPFNPTARQGNLNNTEPLYIAHTHPLLGNGFYGGALDEIEIIRRVMTPVEIDQLFQAGAAGKCPETCYATQNAVCCNGLASNSSITICNYSLSPHTYSWGVSPITGGAGCAAAGPTGFSPASGTVTVAAQSCLTIPIQIACPSNVPLGQSACYQVNIFNHDTGSLFGCQGSVRRARKWCWHGIELGDPVIGVLGIPTGVNRTLQFEVKNVGEGSAPEVLNYMVRPLSGDTGTPSAGLTINGLPPGEPDVGQITLAPGATGNVSIEVTYPDLALIGYDRLVIYGDDDGDGVDDELGEIAVRSLDSQVSAVPGEPGAPAAGQAGERLLLTFPNPFSASDQIRFRVDGDKPLEVKLRLFDLAGRSVKTFYNEQILDPGEHAVRWSTVDDRGEKLRAGIYFLKLEIGKRSEAVKLMVRP